jgi:methylaspartate ammonia-lyase
VIAKAERDRAIDSDVATYRAAVITACTAIKKAITDITDTVIPSDLATIQAKDEEDKTDADKKVVADYEAEVATKFAAFKALFDAPTKTTKVTKTSVSGEEYEVEVIEPTGEPVPMYDWPEQ